MKDKNSHFTYVFVDCKCHFLLLWHFITQQLELSTAIVFCFSITNNLTIVIYVVAAKEHSDIHLHKKCRTSKDLHLPCLCPWRNPNANNSQNENEHSNMGISKWRDRYLYLSTQVMYNLTRSLRKNLQFGMALTAHLDYVGHSALVKFSTS